MNFTSTAMLEIILFYNFFNLKFKEANVIRLIKVLNVSDKHDYKTFHKSYNRVNKDYCIDQSIGKPLRSKIVREHVAMKGTYTGKEGNQGKPCQRWLHTSSRLLHGASLWNTFMYFLIRFSEQPSRILVTTTSQLWIFYFKKDKYLVWSHGANIHQKCGLNSSLLNNIVFHSSPVMTARHNHLHARPV